MKFLWTRRRILWAIVFLLLIIYLIVGVMMKAH